MWTNSAYNGFGLRVQKSDGAGNFGYLTSGSGPGSQVLTDGAAVYTDGLSERRGSGASATSKFYSGDLLGSIGNITDSSGTSVTDSSAFDAFGNLFAHAGSTPTPFGFAGQEGYQTDASSGLQLLGNRFYDPSIGRFLSRDPAGAGDNWYAYCDNNPVSASDPTGLKLELIGHYVDGTPISDAEREYYQQSINYLRSVPETAKVINDLASSQTTYYVVINHDGDDYFGTNNKINWDPLKALQAANYIQQNDGYYKKTISGYGPYLISPALMLGHEAGHAWYLDQSPEHEKQHDRDFPVDSPLIWYDNPKEYNVITMIEVPAAIQLGEAIRDNHGGFSIRVKGPLVH